MPDLLVKTIRRFAARPALAGMAALAVVLAQGAPAAAQAEAVLEAHAVPAERRDAVEAWRKGLPAEVRTVWDERTGRLLLFGPMETHADLLRLVTGQAAAPQGGAAKPQAAVGVTLKKLTPTELHARLETLAQRPLPATWDSGRTRLSFPASLGDAAVVQFEVEAASGAVRIAGPAEAVAAWRDVVAAIEESLAPQPSATGPGGTACGSSRPSARPPSG